MSILSYHVGAGARDGSVAMSPEPGSKKGNCAEEQGTRKEMLQEKERGGGGKGIRIETRVSSTNLHG
jgi:hypothetical protein